MLETKGLTKVYKPKKGQPVTALKDISIRFPDRGMVFLLGKSGSGKSTLLNLLGGLDKYDDGDIVLDGVSTKKFSQADFDSYRNACMGFIFQEYNVLPDFTVGVNIALAIELQGRTASSEEIEKILAEVDLTGYGKRRPNELSGGQLQRVAIARALVKNPKIILADEPTGALDSATGRQIFELLRKLSKDKLVIIVSHDREYSEQYADRIIELADGHIISDVTKQPAEQAEEHAKPLFEDSVCKVTAGYKLTDEDREIINKYLAEHPEESLCIRVDDNLTRGFLFADTKEQPEDSGESLFEKIRSKLPLGRAARIGLASLGCKKLKLFFTVLISVIAFTLFGMSATLADYDYTRSVSKVFREQNVNYAYVQKQKYVHQLDMYGMDSEEGYWTEEDYLVASEQEWNGLTSRVGAKVYPVYRYEDLATCVVDSDHQDILSAMYDDLRVLTDYVEVDEELLAELGATVLVGSLPDGSKDEIAISKVTYDMIRNGSLMSGKSIPKMADMVGAKILTNNNRELTITGIIDTGLDYMAYFSKISELAGDILVNGDRGGISMKAVKGLILISDFEYDLQCNLASKNMVGKGFLERQPETAMTPSKMYWEMVNPKTRKTENSLAQIYDPYVGDITEVDRFAHIDISGKARDLEESSDAPLLPCYITRTQAETILMTLMSVNNRKYFGIDETVKTIYRAASGISEIGNGKEDPENGESGEKPDANSGTPREEKGDFSKNDGDGTEFVRPIALTRQEKEELSAYLEFLTDKAFAELFTKVYAETEFVYRYTNAARNYYMENPGNTDRIYFTLDIRGILLTDEKSNGYASMSDMFMMDTKKFESKIGNQIERGRRGGAMVILPEDRGELEDFIRYSHDGVDNVRFHMFTKYNVELDASEYLMMGVRKVLIGFGIFLAVFAALLMMSFIGSSITYKKHDIGILRAIGSRGNDVYRIFGSESLMIAGICFLLTTILTGVLTGLANRYLVMSIHISLLEFGVKQILLIAGVSVGAALIASFLPVMRFARKRPIDVIRGR
ncbi:MAG: ATP-binding cassette domain-containing protein [Lachnospiraceae bacterium]|nr:ATP-binding cassette domain-containing protein [Lachnospiraceae bacterium]